MPMKKPDGVQNSFDVLDGVRWKMPRISKRWVLFWRVIYSGLASLRRLRVSQMVTRLLGPQYRRSRDLIEIDITYLCNLHCLNCNRSVSQAREAGHISIDTVERFVSDSLARGKIWRRIRVLGGEPTLHPMFHQIIDVLRGYGKHHPDCIIEVVTNGYGTKVERALKELPDDIWVDNSAKTDRVQAYFGPFNLAPMDDPAHRRTSFKNACAVARDCGMGLTPMGYYPCAVAGGIDRILDARLGQASLPADEDDMLEAAEALCRYCGRFQDGHFVPRPLRPELVVEEISPTWQRLYGDWHRRRRTRGEPELIQVEEPKSQGLRSKE